MRATRLLAAVCAGTFSQVALPPSPGPATLLTVPQRDPQRPRSASTVVSLSADGRYVAFSSFARLAPADGDDRSDIYVLDRATGAVTIESLQLDGRPLDAECRHPGLSQDGRTLVFEVAELSLGAVSTIVLRDRARDESRYIGRTRAGGLPQAASMQPTISDDGQFVAFASNARDLVAGDGPAVAPRDVYRYAVASGGIERVSVDARGAPPAAGQSVQPRLSGDGRFVAFASSADLTDGPPRLHPRRYASSPARMEPYQLYVRDMRRGVTRLVSLARGGSAPDGISLDPSISSDGRFVAFTSLATNLVPGDRNQSSDVFLFELASGELSLVSRSAAGGTANGHSSSPAVSADGRFVAFQSDASDLLCARQCRGEQEDIDLVSDVFLLDRRSGLATLVSGGATAWMEESGAPALDARGTVVAFASRHPIDRDDLAHDFDLFVSLAPHRFGQMARR
jgi:Tol biopolymer transport system component